METSSSRSILYVTTLVMLSISIHRYRQNAGITQEIALERNGVRNQMEDKEGAQAGVGVLET